MSLRRKRNNLKNLEQTNGVHWAFGSHLLVSHLVLVKVTRLFVCWWLATDDRGDDEWPASIQFLSGLSDTRAKPSLAPTHLSPPTNPASITPVLFPLSDHQINLDSLSALLNHQRVPPLSLQSRSDYAGLWRLLTFSSRSPRHFGVVSPVEVPDLVLSLGASIHNAHEMIATPTGNEVDLLGRSQA